MPSFRFRAGRRQIGRCPISGSVYVKSPSHSARRITTRKSALRLEFCTPPLGRDPYRIPHPAAFSGPTCANSVGASPWQAECLISVRSRLLFNKRPFRKKEMGRVLRRKQIGPREMSHTCTSQRPPRHIRQTKYLCKCQYPYPRRDGKAHGAGRDASKVVLTYLVSIRLRAASRNVLKEHSSDEVQPVGVRSSS